MKIYKRVLIMGILCAILSACGNYENEDSSQNNYPWNIGIENEFVMGEDVEITMDLIEESLSATAASFTLKNEGVEEASYGSRYCLQIRINKTWYQIEQYADWTLEAYRLASGAKETISVNWENLYGSLPVGEYRFVKEFTIEDETIYLACPFVIED